MAEKLTPEATKQGHLVKVANTNRKKLKSGHETGASAYVAVWVQENNQEECLLFTENQIEVARKRAAKNPEDIPKKGWLTDLLD
jgi:hypothetical protein